ncbi:MAG TPA: glycine--tRNA ligase subunit alpha [Terriglobia bacterium]|nr:glycine--tRNA ligase subunit alpha [Terriglobia bacterium]
MVQRSLDKRAATKGLTFQDMIWRLTSFWARQGAVVALPYDLEVGAGTMCPETFFRVLGPQPWNVVYVQPSRRPADGRYGENPNRLIKHTQLQVILKPPPANVQDIYLRSLGDIGIDFRNHDIRFEEDNWEAPTLGAWGIGWQVMLDGLEITQFTYFQQSGGVDLDPISVELTYGLERIAAFLQNVNNVYEVMWNKSVKYYELRHREEFELSLYDFESASAESTRQLFEIYEGEAARLLKYYFNFDPSHRPARFPLRKVYEFCLKCSHLFNILDARAAISVTERVGLIGRIRKIATEVAQIYLEQSGPAAEVESA